MSKKLKKRIEDICGLVNLDWEARQKRAEQILNNNDWKQQLCNDFQGLSFRDLELHLQSVASERQKKEENVEQRLEARGNSDKPMQRSGSKSTNSPKVVPRTLAQILEQVYRPREPQGFTREELEAIKRLGKERGPDVLQDDSGKNCRVGE